MRTLFTILILLGCVKISYAKSDSLKKKEEYGFFIAFPFEHPQIETSDFDFVLSSHNLPKTNLAFITPGIGLQFFINRFITTFSFNKYTKKQNDSLFSLETEYRNTSFNFGYDIIRSPAISLYPYIGFKGCGFNYLFREKASNNLSFNSYVASNLKYIEVTNSLAHLDVGIGFSHQWFYLINCRFGYLVPMERIRWTMNNGHTELAYSPNIKYNFYFSLTLGFGSFASEFGNNRKYNPSMDHRR